MNPSPRILRAPQLGVNESTARLVRDVPEGTWVKLGAVLCHLETVKALFEVASEGEGFLLYCVDDGAECAVNDPLLLLCATREQFEAEREALRLARAQALAARASAGQATERARRRAQELGIDLARVTAAHGIIQASDVERHAAQQGGAPQRQPIAGLSWPEGRTPVVIYGAGNGGLTVVECIGLMPGLHVVAFVDDCAGPDTARHGLPLYPAEALPEFRQRGVAQLAVAVSGGRTRLKLVARARELGFVPLNVIHPSALLSPSCRLGEGLYVKAGAIIETASTVGDGCIIDNGVVVAHHNVIGEGCHLAPGVTLGSSIEIGAGCVLGIGVAVASSVSIGRGCIITPGSSVTGDCEAFSIIEGVPGRRIGEAKGGA